MRTRKVEARRSYVAKGTAYVSTIQRQIEKVFDLPQGCVRICHPSGRRVRGTSRISTLRAKYGV
jgi:hypothetical protein